MTTVVASAGFGKSTLVGTWATRQANVAWFGLGNEQIELDEFVRGLVDVLRQRVPGLPAELASAAAPVPSGGAVEEAARARAYAGQLAQALQEQLSRDLLLVIDDLHAVGANSPATRLLADLVRQAPEHLHIVVTSREDLPFAVERLRGQGRLLELTAADLAFTTDEIADLLRARLGDSPERLPVQLRQATGGWPAAVRMLIEAHRPAEAEAWATTVARLRRRSGPFFRYLAEEVIAREPRSVRRLITTVAPLRRFNADLCVALGIRDAPALLPQLDRRGLFVEADRTQLDWYALSPMVREYALDALVPSASQRKQIRSRAARWLAGNGHAVEALRTVDPTDSAFVAELLIAHGDAALSAGATGDVLRAAEAVVGRARHPVVDRLEGQARQIRGDWEGALACFDRAAGHGALPAALAWRMGLIHHLRGDLDAALAIYDRAQLDSPPDRETALLLGWRAGARWLLGDLDGCRADADLALAQARALDDPRALASAHTVQAMLAALVGDRRANDAHYLHALDQAERAGDVLQLIRIRTNRGSRLIEEGAYYEALAELDAALRYADLAGFVSFRGLALSNRGEALLRLGKLEEATAELNRSRQVYQSIGSRMAAYPLTKLGEAHLLRGDRALARLALEEARRLAEDSHDRQALVPALSALALVIADEDPEAARQLVERAVALGAGTWQGASLLAAARVALAVGDMAGALDHAAQAEEIGRQRRDPATLAEALEIRGSATQGRADGQPLVEQAIAAWQQIGAQVEAARAQMALARLLEPAAGSRLAAEAAARLAAAGARELAAEAEAVAAQRTIESAPVVAVSALGGFGVARRGQPVPLAAWQSRKARDLLKILVARRGHPLPREGLMELLWPEEEPAALGNRLSVVLSTLRTVLDPEHQFETDYFVAADKDSVRLRLENVEVDVESFLAKVAAGIDLHRRGEVAAAVERLSSAEAAYVGELFEEDPYADWAVGLREEARGAYVSTARLLAHGAAQGGDHDAATRLYLRILERDAYDEGAYLGLIGTLIAAGRHGEARRWYRTYGARMDDIGVEAAAYPDRALSKP
ncbi:MAG TPA: BTAD domain-containing putative transcriptional regulator [Candidatus Limnocylindria bacterium]|nr:BTAD domain-containing putative transcriptional regulator [Candidatus Limnocylindria bacterium]